MTYKEIVYSILNELKLFSDDADFTPEHVIYLVNKYRLFFLKQHWDKKHEKPSQANYQEICIDLEEVPALDGLPCTGGSLLRSTEKIPIISDISDTQIYIDDFFQTRISFVVPEKMRYVGFDKWKKNIIYASIPPDNYLYLKSSNPQYLYLEKIRLKAIFDEPEDALPLLCDKNVPCDILDVTFPVDGYIVPEIQQAVVQEVQNAIYRPADVINNGYNDFSQNNAQQAQTQQKQAE